MLSKKIDKDRRNPVWSGNTTYHHRARCEVDWQSEKLGI